MENSVGTQSNSIKWLSTFGGISAFLVFFSHLRINVPFNILFILGRAGVVGFFLKMGYLSYSSRNKRSGLQYLFNRLVRMYPVFWVILILAYITDISEYSFRQILANMTLFNDFIGYDCLLPSWMMPIQVCFFIMIAVIGVKIFDFRKDSKADMYLISTVILGILALTTAYIRKCTGINLPTAFFLLFMAGIIGMDFYVRVNDKEEYRLIIPICVYFFFLIPSVYLSYTDMWISYLIAYSLGFLLFYIVYKVRLNIDMFNKLSTIGFPFFLGAKIPSNIIFRFIDVKKSAFMIVLGCIIEFVTAIIFAYLIYRFVEKPLLNKAKHLENKISIKKIGSSL